MQKSKKIYCRYLLVLSLLVSLITGICTSAFADSYTYDIRGNQVPAPDAYELERTVYASELGLESMSTVSAVYYRNGKVYVTLKGTIVIADENFENAVYITEYTRDDGTKSAINAPTGIWVTEDGHIYICEMDQGEIIEFDENYKFVRAIGDPNCIGLTVAYKPKRIAVDSVGRMYVLVNNCYEGFAELDPEGNFNRYVGATPVTVSLIDRFWRSIQTEAQQARSSLWLPTTYSDLAIDAEGFLYASIADSTSKDPIRKLNASGDDVMPESEFTERPMGDFDESGKSLSNLTNIAVADDGRFAVLDSVYSRIFVYSNDGNLMYEFGGSGNAEGRLNSPVGICFMGEKVLAVDLAYQSIEVFAPTEYGHLINQGLEAQSRYDYEEASTYWQKVLDINSNFYYANLGLGKYQLRAGDYEDAMDNFYKGGDRSYYSSAFAKVSKDWMSSHFSQIILVLVLVIVLLAVLGLYKKYGPKEHKNTKVRRFFDKLKFTCLTWPGYVMTNPFKAFDDVKYYDGRPIPDLHIKKESKKHEYGGSLAFAIVVIILFGWISLIKFRYTGFLLAFEDIDNMNAPLVVGSALLPYVIFIFANWGVGVLLSGKGKVVHITKVVGYALYPACWLNLVGTLLSNLVTQNEAALVNALFVLGMLLFFFYMFIGTIMVNQYSFTKNVATLLLSVVAMLLIMFVILLFATLFSQFVNDVLEIVTEINLLW